MNNMNFHHDKNNYTSIERWWQSGFAAGQSLLILISLCAVSNAGRKPINNQSLTPVANVLRVGSGQTYSRVQDAAAAAQDGDTIEIFAGTYSGNDAVAVWTANNLTVRGVGGRPHLQANGAYVWGKGIWVAAGSNLTVENIEFSGAAVPDHNGAGIRLDGSGLTVRNCYFHDNENGVLTAANGESDVLIEYSEFYRNGLGIGCDTTGCAHNMYIGRIRNFTLRGSYSHGARRGHEVKSRAAKNLILYNRLSDEQDGTASYVLNLPNGGDCYVIGNIIQKGPNAENPTAVVTFAEEGASNTIQQLRLINNTLVSDLSRDTTFVRIDGTPSAAILTNNIFVGSGRVTLYAGAVLTNNLVNQDALFVNRAGYDYHLTANSPAINAGTNPGTANGTDLTPTHQYVYPTSTEARTTSGSAIDIGAFEYGSTQPNNNPPSVNLTAPANNASFSAPANINIAANAADSDGVITKVEFYAGNTKIGEDATTPYNLTWTNVSAGTYAITAKAFDNAGASTTSAAVAVTVNADSPSWIKCADENAFCAFTGTRQVRYGANGIYATGTFTNGVPCTNQVFGDPIVGVYKSCEVAPASNQIPNGTYKITAKHSGKALGVRNGSPENGATIEQQDYAGGNSQKWIVEALNDGTYKLTSLGSGKALDVCGVSTDDGACIIQYDFWGGDNQRWRIEPVGNGYYRVIAKHSGKALDVSGVSYDNGASVHQWTYFGNDNQLWRIDVLGSSASFVLQKGTR